MSDETDEPTADRNDPSNLRYQGEHDFWGDFALREMLAGDVEGRQTTTYRSRVSIAATAGKLYFHVPEHAGSQILVREQEEVAAMDEEALHLLLDKLAVAVEEWQLRRMDVDVPDPDPSFDDVQPIEELPDDVRERASQATSSNE